MSASGFSFDGFEEKPAVEPGAPLEEESEDHGSANREDRLEIRYSSVLQEQRVI